MNHDQNDLVPQICAEILAALRTTPPGGLSIEQLLERCESAQTAPEVARNVLHHLLQAGTVSRGKILHLYSLTASPGDLAAARDLIHELVVDAPNHVQIGGTHYRDMPIQPWDFIAANRLDFFQGNAIAYICRYHAKGGIEDLRKARHYLDKMISLELAAPAARTK